MTMEKRRAFRIPPFVASCRYVVAERRHVGLLTDLSRSGARVHSEGAAPADGGEVVVEVKLGQSATHLRIPGTVRWSRPSPRGGVVFGMSFDGIGPAEQQVLDEVIQEFRRRAALLA
jgi:PilZ domain